MVASSIPEAVILAGGDCKRMAPLQSIKALLPIANKPLISYPLRQLSQAGIQTCYVVSPTHNGCEIASILM